MGRCGLADFAISGCTEQEAVAATEQIGRDVPGWRDAGGRVDNGVMT